MITRSTSDSDSRKVCFVVHKGRPEAQKVADWVEEQLKYAGVFVSDTCDDCEIVVAFGGDGTILDAINVGRIQNTAVLGINLGHVGFIAEAEVEALDNVVQSIISRDYDVEERMTIDVTLTSPNGTTQLGWAVNELVVAKRSSARMIEIALGVDGRAISTYNTDGIVLSTPTGSTAYALSCGGPVVWPDVEALLVVPIAAHALFTKPLVVGPASIIEVQVISEDAVAWCDGRRMLETQKGSVLTVHKGKQTARLARLNQSPFSGRLVRKFQIPTKGWRSQSRSLEK